MAHGEDTHSQSVGGIEGVKEGDGERERERERERKRGGETESKPEILRYKTMLM